VRGYLLNDGVLCSCGLDSTAILCTEISGSVPGRQGFSRYGVLLPNDAAEMFTPLPRIMPRYLGTVGHGETK
jgi:hypothetical protein